MELMSSQVDEEKRTKSRQKWAGALSRLEEVHGLTKGRCGLWLGFSKWAQRTAVELLQDIVLTRTPEALSTACRLTAQAARPAGYRLLAGPLRRLPASS